MPAEFDLAEVEAGIVGSRFSGQLHHVASTPSSNQLALDAAAAGARAGVWIANEQTAGRGRGGHSWHSAAGEGLYVSVLVAPQLPLAQAGLISLATGLAVQAAILESTGLGADLRWPNDLMFGSRKCGGILVESVSDAAGTGALRYAVIGVGVNVNQAGFPADLEAVATSLASGSGRRFARTTLLGALLRRLDLELVQLDAEFLRGRPANGQASTILERFKRASSWVCGKRVRVDEAGGYTGWTTGLDANGFLEVTDDRGTRRVVLSGGVRAA